jgi:hypothetical protein
MALCGMYQMAVHVATNLAGCNAECMNERRATLALGLAWPPKAVRLLHMLAQLHRPLGQRLTNAQSTQMTAAPDSSQIHVRIEIVMLIHGPDPSRSEAALPHAPVTALIGNHAPIINMCPGLLPI